ncbi:ribonuclease H-like domain-containing protein [Tanacetum coccineum]|uniref:Ribonuclease H-like domain-containing protein n=1 Tax=Tanacetum coccineum TaxID=301880 RepID=A0ABQ4WYF4_9ASTR
MSASQDEISPPPPPPPSSSQTPTQQTPHTVSTIKLPILKKGEYDIWAMKMEHYLAYTDYLIWEVIQIGNARERERKARTTLLIALPEDHLAKFHKMTDAKEMWDAIKSRFGGNDESKKMQKYILKQQFEGFSISNTEGLHKGYDRFQSLLSQLEIHGAGVSTEDANQKFLRSLPSAWSQVSLIMRTKPGVDSLSFDDLYNNLRVFESDIKGSTASSSSPQNVAFVSENSSSTNEVSTAYCVPNLSGQNSKYEQTSSYSLLANQSSCPQLDHEDLEQIDEYDLEEMDLKWQVAMISMRMKKFYKKTGRKLQFDAKEPVGFDKTKVECYNCHKTGHFARECRIKGTQDNRRRDAWNSGNKDGSRTVQKEDSKALVTIDGEGVDWTNHSEDEDYALMACNSSDSDTEVISCTNKCKESYANLKKLYDAQREQLSDASIEIKAYSQGLKKVEAQLVAHQQGQLWYEQKIKFMKIDLDDKTDVLTYHKKLLAEAQKEKEDLKAKVEKWHNSSKNLSKLLNTQISANDKFGLGLGYGDHRYDGILSYENEMLQSVFMNKESEIENQPLYDRFVTAEGMHVVPPPMTGNYMPSGPDIEIDDSNVEPSELVSEPVVNKSNVECQPKVWSDAPIIEEYETDSEDECVSIPTKQQETPSFANQQVKTHRENVKSHFTHSQKPKVDKKDLGHGFAVRACFVCGSLNHLIRDCDFYEKRMARKADLNNGCNWRPQRYPGGIPNTMVGSSLRNDYPHRALKNKGIVDSGCSRHMTGNKAYLAEFQTFWWHCYFWSYLMKIKYYLKSPDKTICKAFNFREHVPRRMACLFGKAITDESNKWHRRLGHVNFKNLNKLVKGNLVRGLPSKLFQNDHTCVACQKGKQHKASCKAKIASSISYSLQLLHMDLFGPTSVRNLNYKTYCLVITDDFSRSDNGTEFKNRDVIEFCGLKGIKREYSNARTPQQNGVAERKNMTLIEAARTMLADSFLPNTFLAEAVSTACYVLNRNQFDTIDHLGKFAGKSDEWFLVGEQPNVAGKGQLLFDIVFNVSIIIILFSLENQANLHAGQQEANQNAGTEDISNARDSEKEDESTQDCFVLPIWPSYSATITPELKTAKKRDVPREEDQVFMDELERLKRQEKEAYEEAEASEKFEALSG